MQLLSLAIQNFRVIQSARIDFPDAVIGIIGPNGAGKSTLVEAITWVLYGNQVSRSGKDEIKSTFATESENCEVALSFKIHDHVYRMTRKLVGRSQRVEVELFRDELPQSIGSTETKGEITKLLGLDWRGFLTSFLARQQELNALSELQPSKRRDHLAGMLGIERIDRAIQSVKADVKVAEITANSIEHQLIEGSSLPTQITALKEQVAKLETSLAAKSGARTVSQERLEAVTATLREHEANKQACSQVLSRIESGKRTQEMLVEQSRGVHKTLAELSASAEEIQRLIPKVTEHATFVREHAALTEAKIRAEQRQNLARQLDVSSRDRVALESKLAIVVEQLKTWEAELAALSPDIGERVETGRLELEQVRGEFARLQAEIESSKKEIAKLDRSRSEIERIGPEALCDRCRRPFGKEIDEIRSHLKEELASATSGMTELQAKLEECTKLGKALRERLIELERQGRLRQETMFKRENGTRERTEVTERLKQGIELHARLAEQLAGIGEVPFDAARFEQVGKNLIELETLKDRYNQLLGKVANRGAVEAERDQIESRLAAAHKQIDEYFAEVSQIGYVESEHAQAAESVAKAQAEYLDDQDRFAKTGHELELTIKELRLREEQYEKQEFSRKELERLRNDQYYGEALARLFGEFRRNLIARIRPRLAELSSQLMSDMTDGRYSMVELDEEYNIRMFDDGSFFGIERFSGGEKDLANLCLRLAISQALTESAGLSRSFVILDEVFASQDENRRELIVKGLANLKSHFPQVLLITHIPEIKDMVERVISVDRTTQGWSEVRENGK